MSRWLWNPTSSKAVLINQTQASKFGNAAMFGAGATFGGNMVNDALSHF